MVHSNFLRAALQQRRELQWLLLMFALLGTSMVIGDGVLTPAVSVFSAVSGLKLSMVNEQHQCRSICFLLTFRSLLLDDDVVPAVLVMV